MTTSRRLTPGLLLALGFVAAVGPFSTDMYLASFTDIARDLGTDASAVQLTLTAFLVGIGAGQLVLGPLSDRVGRRPVLVAAVALFAAASAALVFTPTIELFVILRFVQGFGGAAGVVLSRAIAVDVSPRGTAVRALSLISMVVGIAPLIAPPLGGVVSQLAGWRAVMAVLAVIGLAMVIVASVAIPESLPPEQRHAGGIGNTVRMFGGLLRDPGFPLYTASFALTFAAIMAYVSASPFVGQVVLGMTPVEYSLGFAAGASAVLLSTLTNSRVAVRFGPRRMLVVGLGAAGLAAASLLVLTLTGALAPASFILSAFVLGVGLGFTMPNASALGLARADHARGAGSALMGASQFLLGGLVSPLVGLGGEDTAVPMAVVIASCVAAAGVLGALALATTRAPRR